MADDDWSPEKELDPVELQRQQLELGREFMAKIKEKEREEAERKKQFEEAASQAQPIHARVGTPPTFEEVSAALTKCWEEAKRAVPDAPDHVKVLAFQSLLQADHRYAY